MEVSAAAVGVSSGPTTRPCSATCMGSHTEWADAAKRGVSDVTVSGVCRVHRAESCGSSGRGPRPRPRFAEPATALGVQPRAPAPPRVGKCGCGWEIGKFRHGSVGRTSWAGQPGMAMLLLAGGEADAAAASIERSLDQLTWNGSLGRACCRHRCVRARSARSRWARGRRRDRRDREELQGPALQAVQEDRASSI
jgi:hypothetical protein